MFSNNVSLTNLYHFSSQDAEICEVRTALSELQNQLVMRIESNAFSKIALETKYKVRKCNATRLSQIHFVFKIFDIIIEKSICVFRLEIMSLVLLLLLCIMRFPFSLQSEEENLALRIQQLTDQLQSLSEKGRLKDSIIATLVMQIRAILR